MDPKPGQLLQLLVRPHKLVLNFGETVNGMEVRIERRKFLGDRYEYACTSTNGTALVAISPEFFEVGWEGKAGFYPGDGYLLA